MTRRTDVIQVRCSPEEKALWQAQADREGRSLSEVVRDSMYGVRSGLGSGEVSAGSPPVAGAGSPEPSPLAAGGSPGGAKVDEGVAPQESKLPTQMATGRPAPAASGTKQFRPDPKRK